MLTRCRVSCPIIDKIGSDLESNHVEAADLTRKAQRRIHRTKKNSKHRRGNFTALAAGVSFGGGRKVYAPSHVSLATYVSR
jgi:hypothetical protein